MHRWSFCRVTVLTSLLAGLTVQHGQHAAGRQALAPTYSAVDGDPVDLSTGLYVRTTVDLAFIDTVPVVFSRTYRNRDSRSRPFGIGTNHSFGSFLVGDASTFSYVDLILPDGGRIHFERTSPGRGLIGAEFLHTSTPSEYRNSRLLWNGRGWTIQMSDGGVYTYPSCPPSLNKPCTVSGYRDPDGNQLRMRHDSRLNLVRIEAPGGAAIDLTYDTADRIVLARSSYGQQVAYEYDPRGRLVRVKHSDGHLASYAYDRQHQMIQIEEPGISITNTYDSGGRCIVNDVRIETMDRAGDVRTERELFKFAYTMNSAGRITATEVERPRGRRKVTFNDQGYSLTDSDETTRGVTGTSFARDDTSNVVQRLSVWCGAARRQVKVDAAIAPDAAMEAIRRQLQTTCATAAGGP